VGSYTGVRADVVLLRTTSLSNRVDADWHAPPTPASKDKFECAESSAEWVALKEEAGYPHHWGEAEQESACLAHAASYGWVWSGPEGDLCGEACSCCQRVTKSELEVLRDVATD
jgi:hypothetical protein